jgi:hypothetical protein
LRLSLRFSGAGAGRPDERTSCESFARSYVYDELNRLKSMASTGATCTALEWTYDIWANRTNQNIGQGGAACGTHHPTINVKNQIADIRAGG